MLYENEGSRRKENTTAKTPKPVAATASSPIEPIFKSFEPDPTQRRMQPPVFEMGPDWAKRQLNKTVVQLAVDAAKFIRGNDHAAGLPLINRAIRLCSDEAALHSIRAIALTATDRFDDAIQARGRSINLDLNYAETHVYLGTALMGKGRDFKMILEAFDRAAELDAVHPLRHFLGG